MSMIRRLSAVLLMTTVVLNGLPQTAIALAPESTTDSGEAALQRRDWVSAERLFRERLVARPEHAQTRINLGIAIFAQGRFEEAATEFETAARLPREQLANTPAVANLWLARASLRLGHKERGLAAFEAAVDAGLKVLDPVKVAPELAQLTSERRFVAALDKVHQRARPCQPDSKFQELRFLLGDWDQLDDSGRPVAVATIAAVSEGCGFMETTTTAVNGNVANALHVFDPALDRWHRLYVDSSGSVGLWIGEWMTSGLRYRREAKNDDGTLRLDEETLEPLGEERIRQQLRSSRDGGKNWKLEWEGTYVRRVPSASG